MVLRYTAVSALLLIVAEFPVGCAGNFAFPDFSASRTVSLQARFRPFRGPSFFLFH